MLSRRPQDGQGMSRVKSDKMVCTSSKDPGLSWMELAIQYACNKNEVTECEKTWTPNSTYWITDSLSVELGFRITIVCSISGFLEMNSGF